MQNLELAPLEAVLDSIEALETANAAYFMDAIGESLRTYSPTAAPVVAR